MLTNYTVCTKDKIIGGKRLSEENLLSETFSALLIRSGVKIENIFFKRVKIRILIEINNQNGVQNERKI